METSRFKYFLLLNKITCFKLCFVVIYLLFNSHRLFAQNIDNLHIEKVQEEGLSNNYINCISQDKNGFLWFGTREGIFRYDGYNFKPFKNFPGDSTTLINNFIITLYPDKNNLWIGSREGLSCLDINTQTIKNFTPHQFIAVNAIVPKNDSVLWVGTYTGLYQFNKKNQQWKKIQDIGKGIFIASLSDDQKDRLYIATNRGFYIYTKSTQTYKYYHPDFPIYPKAEKNSIRGFVKSALDQHGNLWLSTWGSGLIRFDIKNEKISVWSHQTDDVNVMPYFIIIDMLPDDYGNIWLANKEGGLTIFCPSKNKFTNYPVEWKSENKISGSVVSLFRDRSGIVWIGTSNGIFKYDPHHVHLSKTDFFLKTDTGLLPAHISPLTMLKEKDGLWWMGMYEGLFTFDQKKGILQEYDKNLGLQQNFAVFNICHDQNGVTWLTSRNLLVKVFRKQGDKNGALQSEIFNSPDIKSTMTVMYIDHENRIWIGTNSEGVFRFDPATKKFISYNYTEKVGQNKINEINAFCELSKDSLLIAGDRTGLILLHTNSGKYEKPHWSNINGIAADLTVNTIFKRGNDLWIGTEYNGLWKTDRLFKKPIMETINDGLPSMSVSSILADKRDNLWLLTNAGAVEFHIPDKKITVFDKKDGIQNLDQFNSMIADTDGNISIAGRGCIYNFNPARILKNTQPPKVLITDLKVFDKEYNVQQGETIKLNYNQNYFSFDYVALNYTLPRLNRYAYKMGGLDKKWNDAGSRRYVSYANLEEGTYVFNVKACNNEGVWNNIPAKLIIIISPPFWHRWWFYLSFAIIILSIMYIVYAYNVNQLKIRMQLRDKIARDLHDDIGSTLSGINIFSKIALQKMNSDRRASRELLEKISDKSEKTLDALSDIVWSINTRNDGVDNFMMKAREYLSEVLEVQGINYDFTVDQEIEFLKIGMGLRKELYLIFKEAIYNASKYSKCSFIQICLTRYNELCKLTIHDNGKGFNVDSISSGNGIYNMRHRAERMNATFDIESGENRGTLITLSFHIPRFR